jgi:hypothetical protein
VSDDDKDDKDDKDFELTEDTVEDLEAQRDAEDVTGGRRLMTCIQPPSTPV